MASRTPDRRLRPSRPALRAGSAGRRARRRLVAVLAIVAAAPGTARAVVPIPLYPINAPDTISGICFHDGDLYAVDKANILIRYDPATGEKLEIVSPLLLDPPDPHIHGIAAAGDTFWVGDVISQKLYELRFSDYAVVRSIDAPPGNLSYGLTFHNGLLWVGQHSVIQPTPVHAMDPRTGEIVATLEFGAVDVHGLAWVAGFLWSLDNRANEIDQVDAIGQVHDTFPLPVNTWFSFAYDGTSFWIGDRDMFYIVVPVVSPAGDLNGDGVVNVTDLLALLTAWGPCPPPPILIPCPADLDGDGLVGVNDLLILLADWG